MKKLLHLWESVVYVGMKPGSAPLSMRIARGFGPFRKPVERFLAGGLPPDSPMYLSNRTLGQRLRLVVVITAPCLLLVAVLTAGISGYIHAHQKPVEQLSSAEFAAKLLPNVNSRDIHVTTNRDLEVVDATVESGNIVAGLVRNNTSHDIDGATVVFDLTTSSGARLGAVAATIPHAAPHQTVQFHITAEQTDVAYALVREVRLH